MACFRRGDLNDLMTELCEMATKYRFYFWIEHMAGEKNKIADALSRGLSLSEIEDGGRHTLRKKSAKVVASGLMTTWSDYM